MILSDFKSSVKSYFSLDVIPKNGNLTVPFLAWKQEDISQHP